MPDKPLIFLTGATGFLGSSLLRALLHAGHTVRALRRADSRLDLVAEVADQVEWVEGDVLDVPSLEDALIGVDTVVHAAALVSFDPADERRLMEVNCTGTANVVNAALFNGVRRLVHISSVAALGRKSQLEPIDESARWQEEPGPTAYARSKFQAEREIWRGQAEGLSVASLYPSVILGAGRWGEGSPQLFPFIDRGFGFYPPGASGFVDVRDVATALLLVLRRDRDGDRFLINAENVAYRELFALIARSINRPIPGKRLRGWQTGLLWRLDRLRTLLSGQRALITRETAQTALLVHRYDNSLSVRELNLRYRPLEETIRETGWLYLAAKGEAGLPAKVLQL